MDSGFTVNVMHAIFVYETVNEKPCSEALEVSSSSIWNWKVRNRFVLKDLLQPQFHSLQAIDKISHGASLLDIVGKQQTPQIGLIRKEQPLTYK